MLSYLVLLRSCGTACFGYFEEVKDTWKLTVYVLQLGKATYPAQLLFVIGVIFVFIKGLQDISLANIVFTIVLRGTMGYFGKESVICRFLLSPFL